MKVLVPDLPSADDLLPYLRRIDAAQHYSNDGPLVRELEARTGGVAVSSGTVGLELAAKVLFDHQEIRIPAFTFPATATAVIRAGFTPVLCDVDRETWALRKPCDRSLIVSPFGAPVSGYLVDAASAWGNGCHGNLVYSLHATKVFPAGEGGLVVGVPDLLERVRSLRNFGFVNGLVTHGGGTNAKLSEYHAAVALASLARLDHIRRTRLRIEARYRENLAGWVEVQDRPQTGGYAIFPVLIPERDRVAQELADHGIETRKWYLPTLESHPYLAKLQVSGSLPVAKMLGESLLCLPFHTFMQLGDVDLVCERVRVALRGRQPLRATA